MKGKVAILVGAVVLTGVFCASYARSRPSNGLEVDQQQLNLGSIWEADSHPFVLSIKNTGSTDQRIDSFDTSCSCLSTDALPVTIPAKQAAPASFGLDLSRLDFNSSEKRQRPFEIRILPTTDGKPTIPATWIVSATIQEVATISPGRQVMPTFYRGQQAPTVPVVINSRLPLSAIAVTYDKSFFTELKLSPEDPLRTKWRGQIQIRDDISAAPFQKRIKYGLVSSDGRPLVTKWSSIEGMLLENVYLVTPSFQIGRILVGDEFAGVITLRSRDSSPFSLLKVTTSEPDSLSIDTAANSSDGSDLAVGWRCMLRRAGDNAIKLTLTVQQNAQDAYDLVYRINFHGT